MEKEWNLKDLLKIFLVCRLTVGEYAKTIMYFNFLIKNVDVQSDSYNMLHNSMHKIFSI